MKDCRFRHPARIRNRYEYEYKSEYNQRRPNANIPNYNQHNYNNRQWGGPQVYNTGYNQHRIQNAQGSHMNNNQNFPQYYQTPENTMSTQQMLSRILGSIEKMDARVNHMQMRQTNNWNY